MGLTPTDRGLKLLPPEPVFMKLLPPRQSANVPDAKTQGSGIKLEVTEMSLRRQEIQLSLGYNPNLTRKISP